LAEVSPIGRVIPAKFALTSRRVAPLAREVLLSALCLAGV